MRTLFVAVLLLLLAPLAAGAQTNTSNVTSSQLEKPLDPGSAATATSPPASSLTLGASEEHNDNVNEESQGQSDWVSMFTVVGNYSHQSSRLSLEGVVDGSYNIYALGNHSDEFKGFGRAKATVAIVPGLLILEGQDQIRQVFSNLTEGESTSDDSSRGQVFQNTGIARMYLTPRLSDRFTLKFGGDYTSVVYDSTETNKQYYGIFLFGAYDLHPRLSLTAESEANHMESQLGDMEKFLCSGGFVWNYSSDGSLQAKAGPRFSRYSDGSSDVNIFWSALATQKLGRYIAALDSSSLYTENPSTTYATRTSKIGATFTRTGDRSKVEARGEYSILNGQDTQQTEQATLKLSGNYELTPRLLVKASGARTLNLQTSSSNTRWYADVSLEYSLAERYTVGCYYKWKLSDASAGGDANYVVNRMGVTIKRTF